MQGYRCPGLELYGTEGTASLIGDDWDPRGVELLTAADGRSWRTWSPPDTTWLWTDGLRELVVAAASRRCSR